MRRLCLVGLVMLVAVAAGCSHIPKPGEAVGLTRTAPAVEPAPVEPYRLTELARQAAAYVQNRLTAWQAMGLDQAAHGLPQTLECAEAVSAYVGAPASVPDTPLEALTVAAEAGRLQAEHNEAVADHAESIAAASRRPAQRGWSVSSGMLGSLVLWKCIAGSTALAGLWAAVSKLLLKSKAGLIVKSVSALLGGMAPADEAAAKTVLGSVQDKGVEKLVDALKRR